MKKTKAAIAIKNDILTMKISPGEMLDESELASQFGLSRTPMREIIQRLSGEGYLVTTRNRGACVAPMDINTMRQFFQAAPMIYASIARLAAENATPAEIEKLKEVQQAYKQTIADGSVAEIAMKNHEFHHLIGEAAASPYLMPSLNRLLIDHTRIAQTFYHSKTEKDVERINRSAKQHDEMIEAFEHHEAARAVELTIEHWGLSRDQMDAFVRPDPLPHQLEGLSNAV